VCVKFNKGNSTLLGENLKMIILALLSFKRCFSSIVNWVNYFFRAVNSRRLNWYRYHKDRSRCKENAREGTSWEAAAGKKSKRSWEGNTITGLRRIACEDVNAIKEHARVQDVFSEWNLGNLRYTILPWPHQQRN
jgi:hypothetical protein